MQFSLEVLCNPSCNIIYTKTNASPSLCPTFNLPLVPLAPFHKVVGDVLWATVPVGASVFTREAHPIVCARIVARRVAHAGCHQRFSEGPDAAPFTACSQNQGHRGRPRRTLRKRRVKGCAERWRPAFRGRARFRHVLAE